jgi:hypothetical protein
MRRDRLMNLLAGTVATIRAQRSPRQFLCSFDVGHSRRDEVLRAPLSPRSRRLNCYLSLMFAAAIAHMSENVAKIIDLGTGLQPDLGTQTPSRWLLIQSGNVAHACMNGRRARPAEKSRRRQPVMKISIDHDCQTARFADITVLKCTHSCSPSVTAILSWPYQLDLVKFKRQETVQQSHPSVFCSKNDKDIRE